MWGLNFFMLKNLFTEEQSNLFYNHIISVIWVFSFSWQCLPLWLDITSYIFSIRTPPTRLLDIFSWYIPSWYIFSQDILIFLSCCKISNSFLDSHCLQNFLPGLLFLLLLQPLLFLLSSNSHVRLDQVLKRYLLDRCPKLQAPILFVPVWRCMCLISKLNLHPTRALRMACSGRRYSQRIFLSGVLLDRGQGLQTHTWKFIFHGLSVWYDAKSKFGYTNISNHSCSLC